MPNDDVTIFVCTACRRRTGDGDAFDLPGAGFADAVERALTARGGAGIKVTTVECLAVCKRPCTVAVVARGKWTYLVGDLDGAEQANEVVEAALSYRNSENGIVPWKERPASFRRGVVARIPPLGFVQPQPETP